MAIIVTFGGPMSVRRPARIVNTVVKYSNATVFIKTHTQNIFATKQKEVGASFAVFDAHILKKRSKYERQKIIQASPGGEREQAH